MTTTAMAQVIDSCTHLQVLPTEMCLKQLLYSAPLCEGKAEPCMPQVFF